jgi:WbqC-like protein family
MVVAIMQPYFLPYIGYFQLINAVDTFVVYDNIKYTKKGWINRNRILVDGKDEYITLPLKKDSDFLNIDQRFLADSFQDDKEKILRKTGSYYKKAPYFNEAFALLNDILNCPEKNLFHFNYQSLVKICNYLNIKTNFVITSPMPVNHDLKAQDRVLAICNYLKADVYINPIGGKTMGLYDTTDFAAKGVELQFLRSNSITYRQFDAAFVPWLSILDVMMFNSVAEIEKMLRQFSIE